MRPSLQFWLHHNDPRPLRIQARSFRLRTSEHTDDAGTMLDAGGPYSRSSLAEYTTAEPLRVSGPRAES